jgi:hypothetical protein
MPGREEHNTLDNGDELHQGATRVEDIYGSQHQILPGNGCVCLEESSP